MMTIEWWTTRSKYAHALPINAKGYNGLYFLCGFTSSNSRAKSLNHAPPLTPIRCPKCKEAIVKFQAKTIDAQGNIEENVRF